MSWLGDALTAGTKPHTTTKPDRKYVVEIAARPQAQLHAIIGVPYTESP